MPSSHLILCCSLFLLPPIPPSIRVFSNESTLHMRWPKYWSFSFSIIPSKEIPRLISFRMDWLDLLAIVRDSFYQFFFFEWAIFSCFFVYFLWFFCCWNWIFEYYNRLSLEINLSPLPRICWSWFLKPQLTFSQCFYWNFLEHWALKQIPFPIFAVGSCESIPLTLSQATWNSSSACYFLVTLGI